METKQGYRTTEFWMITAVILVDVLIASDAIPIGGLIERIVVIVGTILGALGYAIGRSYVKKNGK